MKPIRPEVVTRTYLRLKACELEAVEALQTDDPEYKNFLLGEVLTRLKLMQGDFYPSE